MKPTPLPSSPSAPFSAGPRRPVRPQCLFLLLLATCVLLLTVPITRFYRPNPTPLTRAQHERFQADLAKCAQFKRPPYWEREREATSYASRSRNPRFDAAERRGAKEAETLVLRNARVFDGERWLGRRDVVVRRGVVAAVVGEVDAGLLRQEGVEVVNVHERIITPGLIDMHSHSGVDSYPYLQGTADTNEMSAPVTPYSRVLDAINPHDPAHGLIASGGVTTSLIIPGSANVLGGEGVAVKNAYTAANTLEAMLVEPSANDSRTRWMKMACGENPKRAHKAQANTRMGLAHVLRAHLAAAEELRRQQDAWCERALDPARSAEARREVAMGKRGLREDLELEFTVALLRGQVRLNVHCYETMDIEAMLRHAREFGYRVTAFHHAIDSYRVPDLLKAQGYNITQAMFAEHGFYKKEGYQESLYAGKILSDAGIPVAYKSDHPVSFAKHLVVQASIAHAFRLPETLALASVTSVPAAALGLDHRIGFVREGYDADMVIWDAHPLAVGATPLQVFIDGWRQYNFTEPDPDRPPAARALAEPPQRREFSEEERAEVCEALRSAEAAGEDGVLVVTGIRASLFPEHADAGTTTTEDAALTLVLRNHTVVCLSVSCALPASAHATIALANGYLAPGLVSVSAALGLSEIEQEPVTRDGPSPDAADPTDEKTLVFAKHGAHFGSKLLQRAADAGITHVVTPPLHEGGLLRGVSAGFYPDGESALDGIWRDEVALHVGVGQDARGKAQASVSALVRDLGRVLGMQEGDGVLGRASRGEMPVVVHANNKDDIAQLVKIKLAHPRLRLVLFGGIESPHLAGALAAADIAVILSPWRCAPEHWESQRCLPGPPASASPLRLLAAANVTLGIATAEDDLARDLAMELGWAGIVLGLEPRDAWKMGAANLRSMLGLAEQREEKQEEEEGGGGEAGERNREAPEMVLWEGNPLEGAGVVVAVFGGKRGRAWRIGVCEEP